MQATTQATMQTSTTEQKRNAQTYTDAVGALSEIALSNVERLSTLNQNLARAALQDCLAASNDMLAVRDVNALQGVQASAAAPALAQFADYLRSVQEIAVDSHKQVSAVLDGYFGTLGLGGSAGANMQAGFDAMSRLTRQTRDVMNANMSAASEADQKLNASITPPRKAA